MSLRRALFPALLGILHAYIGIRVVPDLPGGTPVQVAGALLLALSFGLMALSLVSRQLWTRPLADRIATPGMVMAGFFS